MTTRSSFLQVERSVSGRRWADRLTPAAANAALAIAQKEGVPDLVARVLAGRGVVAGAARAFMDPSLKQLMPDPQTMTDAVDAAARLARAIERRERIAIFGDYDVDGAASSAILARFLRHFSLDPQIYIPDRIFEGYGPNEAAMKKLAERASLIVTVDCGANSAGPVAAARGAGADVVVLDHHQIGGPLPQGAPVVNPNRADDLSGLGHLCAAGIVFMVLVETARQLRARKVRDLPDLLELLDLVALATVCDVVPLVGLNRAFVVKGLIAARKLANPGLAALARVARIGEPLNTFHFGYLLGPRINAGGRIGDASLGARLLTLESREEALTLAGELDRLNAERQAMEARMVEEAVAEAEAELASSHPPAVIVTASDDWHPGIAGLIAARLKERTRRPSFAIAFDANGKGSGSGRSIPGFDLGRLVRQAVEAGLLVKGGGHAMAAGLTVARERLGALRAFFEDKAHAQVGELIAREELEIDGALTAEGGTLALIETIEQAGPFGSGHPEPVFALPSHRVVSAGIVGNGHVRATLAGPMGGKLNAIAFRAGDSDLGATLMKANGDALHVAGALAINHWNGARAPQFRIIDAAKPA